VIDDRDRQLRAGRIVLGADVAGHADTLTRTGVDGDQRLVVMVVDLGEVAKLGLGEATMRGQEPPVTRLVAQTLEAIQQCLLIGWRDRSNEQRCCRGGHAGRGAHDRAASSNSRFSAAAISRRVRSTTSIETEMASMPARTSNSAYSG